jgi:hypothetical protein
MRIWEAFSLSYLFVSAPSAKRTFQMEETGNGIEPIWDLIHWTSASASIG